jgi:hypothetical protein
VSDLDTRSDVHARLSARLAELGDDELASLLAGGDGTSRAWGCSYPSSIEGIDVFVKRVPVTAVEMENPSSTKNHFGLPTYYSYGVGSAGFGVYRELAMHEKTTRWVLDRAIDTFPLLLHHRVLPRSPGTAAPLTTDDDYIRKWNSNAAIASYANARASATNEMWMVLEHVPHSLATWLVANQDRVDEVVDSLCDTISFLRAHGIVHFDAHFGNVITDGDTAYLTDFGLALDADFDLAPEERTFLARHRHYDYALAIGNVGTAPAWMFLDLDADDRAALWQKHSFLQGAANPNELALALVDHADELTSGPLTFEPAYAAAIRRYHDVIVEMLGFLWTQTENPRKDTRYDDDHMRSLLIAAGVSL